MAMLNNQMVLIGNFNEISLGCRIQEDFMGVFMDWLWENLKETMVLTPNIGLGCLQIFH